MGKRFLVVRRRGYYRGPYTYRRKGKLIRVRGHYVPPTTFRIPDRGAPGRGKKVVKIKRPGLLNSIAEEKFGKKYTDLTDEQRHEVLKTLKRKGFTEKQILGMMQAQIVFRKRQRDGVKAIFKEDREWVAKELFPP